MNSRPLNTTLILMILLVACQNVFDKVDAPSLAEITKIEKRGKQIADYEKAVIRATDLLLESKPDYSRLEVYFAINDESIWKVYFGRISDDGDEFIVGYTYSCQDGLFNKMKRVKNSKYLSKDILQLSKATRLALRYISTKAQFPRYNTNVFREEDGSITVYITPGNKNPEIILLGGDFKLSISPDGSEILRDTQLHKAVLKIPSRIQSGWKPVGALHTHILDDLPSETGIAFILLNPQLGPHHILGPKWLSKVDANGKITILGKTEGILKKKDLAEKQKK